MSELQQIGKINRTFGVNGELILALYDEAELDIDAPVFIKVDGLLVPFYIKEAENRGRKLMVIFENMESEQLAQELVGEDVFAEQKTKKKDEQRGATLDELEGYSVVDENMGNIGVVKSWLDYPNNPCIQILNEKEQEIIIPASPDLIIDINKKKRLLVVSLPEGLVDIYIQQ